MMGDRLDVDLPNSTYDLDIILVGVNHPGNLGAICRAMLNHGFAKLSLVNPNCQSMMKKLETEPNILVAY